MIDSTLVFSTLRKNELVLGIQARLWCGGGENVDSLWKVILGMVVGGGGGRMLAVFLCGESGFGWERGFRILKI